MKSNVNTSFTLIESDFLEDHEHLRLIMWTIVRGAGDAGMIVYTPELTLSIFKYCWICTGVGNKNEDKDGNKDL